jgi:hypothetical protein
MSGRLYAGPTLQAVSSRSVQAQTTLADRCLFMAVTLDWERLNANG